MGNNFFIGVVLSFFGGMILFLFLKEGNLSFVVEINDFRLFG